MTSTAIKLKNTIAQPFLVAGTPFSLTTTIENAHEGAIGIIEIFFHIPYQMQWIDGTQHDTVFIEGRNKLSRFFLSSAWKKAVQPPGQNMAFKDFTTPNRELISILPGESFNHSFKAILPRWLLVSGGELVFPGSIRYTYKNDTHIATFEVRLTVRPPLVSNAVGATIGSAMGFCARNLQSQGGGFLLNLGIESVASAVLAIILSIIAVIYSSRRTGETQPILTVEDFWGGLIVGFLIGYLGHEFFERIVPIK